MKKTKTFLKYLAVCMAIMMSIGFLPINSVMACPNNGREVQYTVSFVDMDGNTIANQVQKMGDLGSLVNGNNEAIQINGYVYEFSNPPSIRLSRHSNLNKITLVYSKLYNYSVNYYIKGTSTKISPTVTKQAKCGTLINTSDKVKTIFGYSYNYRVPNYHLLVTPNESENVINIYYTPNRVEYTVKHVVQVTGEVLDQGTYFGRHNVEETINANIYTGYSATNAPLTVTPMDGEENVFTVYYAANPVDYTVKHVVKATGEVLDEETLSGSHNASLTINANDYTGYTPLNVAINVTILEGEENVFTIYYDANEVNYTVKHVVQATGEVKDEVSYTGLHGVSETISANSYVGYSATNAPLTVTPMDGAENIFIVYYQANEVSYTVKYVEQGNPSNELLPMETFTGIHGQQVDVNAKEIEGYTSTQQTLSITLIEGEENQLVFEYTANMQIVTVKFLEQGSEAQISDPVTMDVPFATVINVIDIGNIIPGYEYVSKTPDTLVVGANNDVNVITYYFAASEQQYVVKFLNKEDDSPVADEKVLTGVTGQIVTESPIEVDGYSPVDEKDVTITLDTENNTIIFYYEKLEIKVLSEEITVPQVSNTQESNPQTGEHPYEKAWLVWIVSALAAIAILFVIRKKQIDKL